MVICGDEMIENEKNQTTIKSRRKRKARSSRRTKVDQYEVAVGDEVEEDEIHEVEDNDDEDDGGRSPYEPSLAEELHEMEHDVEIDDEDVDGEDDDDIIDADEEDGEPRLSKRGALKHEAKTKNHLLTHRFKNPYCDSCVRAKMKHRKTFRGAFQRKLTKFGDLVTFDYIDNRQIYEHGYGVEKTIFVIRDRYTGMIQAYPSARKDQEAVIRAVKQFMGRRKIREAYSDMAPQFIESMKALKIPMDHSLAGKTKHNSLAERNNQFLLVATTTCLLEAGIPPCFWRYAIRCVSHLLNVEPNDQEVSAWCKLHGGEFKGAMIPFGALVYFKPSGARNVEQKHKFDPMGIPGVFAGYDLAPGLHWSRKYRVWALADWAKQNLAYDTSSPLPKLKTPHYTERVELKEPLEFPCKANFEKINVTIDGLKEKERLDGSPDYIPLPEPEDHDEDGDDGDDQGDDDGDDGPDGGGERAVDSSILGEIDKMEREGAEDVARRAELPLPPGLDAGQDKSAKKGSEYAEVLEHYSEGKSADGKIYLNDDGERVKIDKGGQNYKVDDRGFRKFHNSPRPDKFTPDEWRKIPHEKRKEIKKAQEMEKDAAIEKRKYEKKVKEAEDKALKELKESKKKKKSDDKDASGSKEKPGEHDVGVSVRHDHVRRGKECSTMAVILSLPPEDRIITIMWTLTLLTLMFLVMKISLWIGMKGRRLRMASGRRRHGPRTKAMTLNQVKWSSPLRGHTTLRTLTSQVKIWGVTIHFHVCRV